MKLQPGTRVGPYDVTEVIGAGGMGEVYRARDARLQRDVALKVLPDALGADGDLLARFGREAQILAQLNHPNIASVYGVEDTGGVRALVMELVEGPTLADLLDAASQQGRGLPIADVVDVARQIATAMEAAHEIGIIHRDLKPGNVKLRPDGAVKVLDFGLAKAFDPASSASSSVAAFNSPTLTMRATQAGIILGTAAYMSPEQAKGKAVDRRADIWAFGVVLHEMLCGRAMYTGETVSEILARVIEREPDLSMLPGDTPRRLRELLRRCLVKDPRSRLRDIGEARITLDEIAAGADEPPVVSAAAAAPRGSAWRRVVPWALAGASFALAGAVAWAPWRDPASPALPVHLTADLGVAGTLGSYPPVAISRDGSTTAFVVAASGGEQGVIHVRRLDQTTANPLAGTDGAHGPFFSPDGQWIAYFADRKLKKVAISGGTPIVLCDAPNDRGGSWGEDGTIVFAANNRVALSKVPASGGTPEPFSTLDAARKEVTHRFPHVLPGGDAVLYMAHTAGNNFDESDIVVQRVSDGTRRTVRRGGIFPMYLVSGHLTFLQGATLFAQRFDVRSLTISGDAFPIVDGVRSSTTSGYGMVSASDSGTIVYVRGASDDRNVVLHWMDASGAREPVRQGPLNSNTVAISPDGERVATEIYTGADADVWVYEPARDILTRLTTDPTEESKPVWTLDGARVAYATWGTQDGKYGVDWRRVDGNGDVQRLVESSNRVYPAAWHPDGTRLAYVEITGTSGGDIKVVSIEGDEKTGWKTGTPSPFMATAAQEYEPAFSPDGKWIAYMSSHSGRYEVYMRPYPGPGPQIQVSTAGGVAPRWSTRRDAIFFLSFERKLMVAPFTAAGDSLRPDKPRVWSEARVAPRGANRPYDLHPDGKRAMFFHDPGSAVETGDRLSFLFNAHEEVRRRAPQK